jgi:hypothetical protein
MSVAAVDHVVTGRRDGSVVTGRRNGPVVTGRPDNPIATGRPDGPDVVLSNSLGSTLEMWDANVAALEEHSQVVHYDTCGHGRSRGKRRRKRRWP